MTLRTRRASWIVSGSILLVVASARVGMVGAQPQGGPSRSALDATLLPLGTQRLVNINTIAYTSDGGGVFDIYFACSATRAPDPLRLTDAREIAQARSFFDDERKYGDHFEKYNNYRVSLKHVAFIEFKPDSVVINFNARISDAFVQLTLFGADAESFRKKRNEP